ncbi:MAG: NFACT RNA binding domain-containing protein [Planctomycetota bacterium JB042]
MDVTAGALARLAAEAEAAAEGLEVRALVDAVGGGHLLLLAEEEGAPIAARILVCTDAPRARLHLARPRKAPKPRPAESAFTRDARPLVEGTRLVAVRTRPGDRTVTVALSGGGGGERLLVAELFGSAPNVLLVDEEGIVRALRRRRKGARPLAVGGPYAPPPLAAAPGPAGDADDAPSPPPAAPDDAFAARHPWSAAFDDAYAPLDAAAEQDAERARIAAALHRARGKADGLVRNLERQADAGAEAERWRRRGDLLSASFHLLRRGSAEVELDDFEGGRETVPLDPSLDARGNVEACYKRARKLERAGRGAAERLEAARRRAAELAAIDAAFRDATAAGDEPPEAARRLAAPRERPAPRKDRGGGGRAKKGRGDDPGVRRFTLRSGHRVLVGRSQRDNDRLTLRIAGGNDVWMHVQNAAGSHVVLRREPGRTPSLDDLLDAASLAVHYSKRRGARRVEVISTPRKYVRKRKGMPAGAVTVDRHDTLLVEDGEERVRALFEAAGRDGDGGSAR